MARIREAEGDLDGALDLLDEAERVYVGDFSPNVRPIHALKTRMWVAQGRFGEALGWAREQALSAEDDLDYVREFEHITLARLHLAEQDGRRRSISDQAGAPGAAPPSGGRRRQDRERHRDPGSAGASRHQMRGDVPAALVPLGRALTLAEPEGYVRIFVDEGRTDGGSAAGGGEARDRPDLRSRTPDASAAARTGRGQPGR